MTKLPTNIIHEQSPTNLKQVVAELDKKMERTSAKDRAALQAELEKGIESGFLIETKDLPIDTQEFLWAQESQHFVAVAPAYKADSRSTPIRFTFNFSKKDRKTQLSLNDLSTTGLAPLDMCKTARIFKSSKFLPWGTWPSSITRSSCRKTIWRTSYLCGETMAAP